MTRRSTIHELAETLSILCADSTLADLLEATLSAEHDERLNDYQANLAEALFESLSELRPDCVVLAQERPAETTEEAKPTNGVIDRFVDWATGW